MSSTCKALATATRSVLRQTAAPALVRSAAWRSSRALSATAAPHVRKAHAEEAPAHGKAAEGGGRSATQSLRALPDEEIFQMLVSGALPHHRLEKDLGDASRAVLLRRRYMTHRIGAMHVTEDAERAMAGLPADTLDTAAFYKSIEGQNCENVIGFVPIPVGVAGPLRVDGKDFMIPLGTTEGALIASTNRGCRAITESGGATTVLTGNGMTRAPLIRMDSLVEAAAFREWVENPTNFARIADAFNSTSRFARLQEVYAATAGRNVYLRFKCATGDAMGMNMITKGVNEALNVCRSAFPTMRILSLSGNFCTDKKPSAVNWIDGRGKSVTVEARISKEVLSRVLKTNADALVDLNVYKNLVGSAIAGSIGGFNAHAANIVTAFFLATGQDCAQNVESSTCLTLFEKDDRREGGLIASVTMPSIEVGTVGGGTSLHAQAAALDLLGVRGASRANPGANAAQLARLVAATVLAGELSLMSALTTGDLLSSHLALNRKATSGAAPASPAGHAHAAATAVAAPVATTAAAAVAAAAAAPIGGSVSAAAAPVYAAVAPQASVRGHGPPTQLLSQPPKTDAPALLNAALSPGRRFFAAATTAGVRGTRSVVAGAVTTTTTAAEAAAAAGLSSGASFAAATAFRFAPVSADRLDEDHDAPLLVVP